MYTKTELRELLERHGVRLKKRLGQHYLIDSQMASRLVSTCQLGRDETIVEIGAGLGALTELLATHASQVVAVEVDRVICRLLAARMDRFPNVQVVCQDILTVDWLRYAGSKVVGTIPYHITSPILVSLCECSPPVPVAWLGMQREVANRLTARPGTKAYGRLTILVQYRFHPSLLVRIPRTVFFPVPQVDSAWVQLTARKTPVAALADERLFFDVVRAAFSQRRKMLLNSLVGLATRRLKKPQALEAIRAVGLPDAIRGEELSLEAFAELANTVHQMTTSSL